MSKALSLPKLSETDLKGQLLYEITAIYYLLNDSPIIVLHIICLGLQPSVRTNFGIYPPSNIVLLIYCK